MFQLTSILTALCAVVLLVQPAFAFTPNDEELAKQIRKVYGPLASWEAEMTFPDHPGVSAHIWYARGQWRQEWKAGDTALGVGVNGNVVAQCTTETFPLSPMFVWMVPDPVETWRSWGVDNATKVYGFCDESPCMMIGAEPGEDALPAVHLNNEDMAPLLVRYSTGDSMTTVRFSEYRTKSGFRVPQKVTVDMDGTTLTGILVWKSVLDAGSRELYSREAVDTTPCADPPEPFTTLRDNFRYPEAR